MSLWDKWVERIYAETDIAKSIATSASGLIGLLVYLYFSDLAIACFTAIIVFPIVKVLCSSIQKRTEYLAKLKNEKDGMQAIYSKLSLEEKAVVQAFVDIGGSVMTYGQMNQSVSIFSAVESLANRDLLRTSIASDGIREVFVLDQDLFDIGSQNDLPPF